MKENNFDFIFNLGDNAKYFNLRKIRVEKGLYKKDIFEKYKDANDFLFSKLERKVLNPKLWTNTEKRNLIKILNMLEDMEKTPSVYTISTNINYTNRYCPKSGTRERPNIINKTFYIRKKLIKDIYRKNKYLKFTPKEISKESGYSVTTINKIFHNKKCNFLLETLKNVLRSFDYLQEKTLNML